MHRDREVEGKYWVDETVRIVDADKPFPQKRRT
jgi:hypothetical protein